VRFGSKVVYLPAFLRAIGPQLLLLPKNAPGAPTHVCLARWSGGFILEAGRRCETGPQTTTLVAWATGAAERTTLLPQSEIYPILLNIPCALIAESNPPEFRRPTRAGASCTLIALRGQWHGLRLRPVIVMSAYHLSLPVALRRCVSPRSPSRLHIYWGFRIFTLGSSCCVPPRLPPWKGCVLFCMHGALS
jgi:hypothetical protein